MTDNAVFYPSNVRQPLAGTRKQNPFSCCIEAVGRDGEYEGYYCADRHEPRYYHEWSNAIELTRGGETSCGRPSNYYCNYETYYQIAGYRNTCPIAGCSGTFFQPAVLQLELGKAHLENYDIIEGSEINSITINFNHRSLGVDVSDGSTSTNWGPNFCGFDKHPDLKVLKIYLINEQGAIRGNICVHNQNPPLKGYAGVSATISGITYEDIANGWICIEYQRNLSTDPGNIYIRDLNIRVEYTNAYPAMYGVSNLQELYTSNYESCCTTGTVLIDATYENNRGRIPMSKWSRDIRDDVIVQVPEGVTYTKEKIQEHLWFTFKDNSNKKGVKNIVFTLKGTDKMFICGYKAIKYNLPDIECATIIYKNRIPTDNALSISSDSCVKKADFYVDGVDTQPIVTLTEEEGHFDYTQKNIVTKKGKDFFYTEMADKLSCGVHQLYIELNNDKDFRYNDYIPFYFAIQAPEFEFEYYVETQRPEDDNPEGTPLSFFDYIQNKQDDKRMIKIKRIDNFPTRYLPSFDVYTDINYHNREPNQLPTINHGLQDGKMENVNTDDTALFDVSVKYPGRYTLTVEDNDPSYKNCVHTEQSCYIDVEPNHKQNHDVLFVRGEDSTSFDYDYLVAWEGDNIDEPIHVSDVNIGQSFEDIKICVESVEFFTGLSQIGLAKFRVSNISQKTLNNIRIEMNVLSQNDDGDYIVTLDEFLKPDGVFKYLQSNFYYYNIKNLNNLSILNLPGSIDGDNIGEENVEILIKKLEYDETIKEGDSIEILIPFMSRTDKTVEIQLLVFEEVFPLYLYHDCEFKENPFDNFKLTVYDSILTNMEIIGETDLLSTNEECCPNECFKTQLTYKITNIDSSETESIYTKTKIINDANLIPYQIQFKDSKRTISINDIVANEEQNEEEKRVEWLHNEKYKVKELAYGVINAYVQFPGHKKYMLTRRTNNKGRVIFEIRIPESVSKSYTLKSLLQNVVKFEYQGNVEHGDGILYIDKYNNVINVIDKEDDKRNKVTIDYQHTYKRYKSNDLVQIVLTVTYLQKYLENTLVFYPNIQKVGRSDELTVYYRICNLQDKYRDLYNEPQICYNKGLLNTTFKTDDYQLIENQVSKDIYCGLDTDLRHTVNIEKRIVEQNELNFINIEIANYVRDNKEVKCLIDMGPHLDFGSYDIVEINVDDGNAQIIFKDVELENGEKKKVPMMIDWLIGEMKADTKTNAQIILKGDDIGVSDILINIEDFLSNKDYHFCERNCNCE